MGECEEEMRELAGYQRHVQSENEHTTHKCEAAVKAMEAERKLNWRNIDGLRTHIVIKEADIAKYRCDIFELKKDINTLYAQHKTDTSALREEVEQQKAEILELTSSRNALMAELDEKENK